MLGMHVRIYLLRVLDFWEAWGDVCVPEKVQAGAVPPHPLFPQHVSLRLPQIIRNTFLHLTGIRFLPLPLHMASARY